MAKKYFWLKLNEDFFRDKRIKKLRRVAGGDTYTLIYLKMQLMSLKNEGIVIFEGVEKTLSEEIALEIDEDSQNVEFTVMFLINNNLMQEIEQDSFALIETMRSIGSETDTAQRVRKHRQLKEEEKKALQCNSDVTNLNEKKALHCNTLETNCNLEIEIEIDIDKEIKKKNSLPFGSAEKTEKGVDNVKFVFDYYNSKKIIQHKKINAPMKAAINARLRDYSLDELIQAIDNYTVVYNSPEHYFSQKYGLADLMRDKDVRKFIDDAEPLQNFLINKKGARAGATYQQGYPNNGQAGNGNTFKDKFGVDLDF